MKKLPEDVVEFFKRQGFVVVSTLDQDGSIHNSCKGVVDIAEKGCIYLMDVYRQRTFDNLHRNESISVTAVDEHSFKGYCLKGKARELKKENLDEALLKKWDDKVASRISQRLIRNLRGEKGHKAHPEASLPGPEYLISMEINKIIDLAPAHLKTKDNNQNKEDDNG